MYITLFNVQVKACIHDRCSREFEGAMLDDVIHLLTKTVVGWIQQIYGSYCYATIHVLD